MLYIRSARVSMEELVSLFNDSSSYSKGLAMTRPSYVLNAIEYRFVNLIERCHWNRSSPFSFSMPRGAHLSDAFHVLNA